MATATPASGPGTVNLQYGGGTLTLPLLEGTEGEVGIDIRSCATRPG